MTQIMLLLQDWSDLGPNCLIKRLQQHFSRGQKQKNFVVIGVIRSIVWTPCLDLKVKCIWMHVFCRSGVYYDNVESLFGLKCHFVYVYQFQSDNCCQSVTGAANNQHV